MRHQCPKRRASSQRSQSAQLSGRPTMALPSPSCVAASETLNQKSSGKFRYICICLQPNQLPTVPRYHGKEELTQNSRYSMSLDVDEKIYYIARLEIVNVKRNDRGEYRAIAKNRYGQGMATINLNFEGIEKPK